MVSHCNKFDYCFGHCHRRRCIYHSVFVFRDKVGSMKMRIRWMCVNELLSVTGNTCFRDVVVWKQIPDIQCTNAEHPYRILLFSAIFITIEDWTMQMSDNCTFKITNRVLSWIWGRIEVCTGCWWGSLRERDHWGDQDVDGRIILGWIFRKLEGVVGTGWSRLRIGTGGGHLWVRWGTLGFHKCGEFLD
jgi:hypothetical protein